MKYFVTFAFVTAIILFSCTKDVGMLPQSAQLTDSTLSALARSDAGKYTWHSTISNPDSIFTSTQDHGTLPYKLLMNLTAKNACTDGGKLPQNGIFPDSSLLVKKLYNTAQTQVTLYAVIYKVNGAWKWAEYNAAGSVIKSLNSNSDVCTSCHTSDRDRTWTFDSH